MGKFKKGDWVRVKLGQGTALLRENNIYEVLGHSDRKYPIVAVTCSHGDRHELDYEPERFTLYRSASAPEQPTTLKIEAGKFYKTRDGRKVGPMEQREGYLFHEGWHYNASGECCYRGRSGDCVQKDREIIAEWIDEPVAKPCNDNAKPKFKVGDAIRHKTLKYEGVVEAVLNGETVRTHWTKEGWGASDPVEDIELITPPTPTTAIVALIENGQPKPSSTPHVHTSEVAAHKEAGRLAAKYKGKQFGVFTLTATYHEPKPVYEHKWQNMAALGLKVDAIRELRAVAGLDLLSAKRAVEAFAA